MPQYPHSDVHDQPADGVHIDEHFQISLDGQLRHYGSWLAGHERLDGHGLSDFSGSSAHDCLNRFSNGSDLRSLHGYGDSRRPNIHLNHLPLCHPTPHSFA